MKGKVIVAYLALACVFLISGVASGQELEGRVIEYTLENGMKFLLMERDVAPIFTGTIVFKAGGVDEPRGKTGLAHMFEHMAFKGTPVIGTSDYRSEKPLLDQINTAGASLSDELRKGENADSARVARLREELAKAQEEHQQYVVKNEFFTIYESAGGTGLYAGTANDVTLYYISLPINKLELWMLMESERIKHPVFREFYKERDVVVEERRQRIETQPVGKLMEQMMGIGFAAHPYGNPVVGWMSDISTVTVEDAQEFFKTYYVPNNAVGAIVGDIDIEKTKALLNQYFGDIPAGPEPPAVVTAEPPQAGERRVEVEFNAQPQLLIGYHKPTIPHYEDYVFDVIDAVLSQGRTSRLYTSLVKEKQMVLGVNTFQGLPGARYSNLFAVYAVPRHPFTTDSIETAIYAELERLKTEPVPEQELEKIRNQLDGDFIRRLNSNSGLSFSLAYIDAIAGDWKYILRQREIFKGVSKEDIMKTAKKYFTQTNRIVATIVPKEAP